MPDSTLVQKFFQDLDDPTLFERVEGVPIFTPHITTKRNKQTGESQEVSVDKDDLKEIAKKLQQMEREKGVLPIITPGHRNIDPAFPEQQQPKPWGYARGAEFGHYISPEGKKVPALLTTHYYSRTVRAEDGTPANEAARTYPFRSVDYYAGTKEISGIALLRRDPALDMGLIAYGETDAQGLFHYAEENVMPAGPQEPKMPDPTTPPSAEATPGSPMDDELTPEEAHTAMRYMKHYEKHHPVIQHMCQQHAMIGGGGAGGAGMGAGGGPGAGGAAAGMQPPASLSPTNGAMPGGGMRPRPPEKKPGNASPIQNARGRAMTTTEELPQQYARELAIRDSHIEAMQKEIASMKAERAVEREASQLLQYQAQVNEAIEIEGCQFDGKKFIELHQKDAPEQFKKHLDFVREMSPRAPVERLGRIFAGNGFEGASIAKETGKRSDGSYDEGLLQKIYQYQRETGDMNFEGVKAKILAQQGA